MRHRPAWPRSCPPAPAAGPAKPRPPRPAQSTRAWDSWRALERVAHGRARALRTGTIEPRQRNAHQAGEDHVDQHDEDGGPGALRPQQGHQQRHAHETGVGKSRDQGAESSVVPADAGIARERYRARHHDQGAQHIHPPRPGQQLANGRAGAKAVYNMQGSAKYSTKALSPQEWPAGASAAPRGQVAAQHQREERKK